MQVWGQSRQHESMSSKLVSGQNQKDLLLKPTNDQLWSAGQKDLLVKKISEPMNLGSNEHVAYLHCIVDISTDRTWVGFQPFHFTFSHFSSHQLRIPRQIRARLVFSSSPLFFQFSALFLPCSPHLVLIFPAPLHEIVFIMVFSPHPPAQIFSTALRWLVVNWKPSEICQGPQRRSPKGSLGPWQIYRRVPISYSIEKVFEAIS